MAIQISNISVTQSFGVVVQRINDITDAFSANVVTTGSLAGGAVTTGNAFVNGMFGANTLFATTITGGNVSTNTSLYVSSNTYVNNYLSVGNTTINASFGYVTATQAIGSFYASTNSFIQTTTTNENTGSSASSDWAAYNDDITQSSFIDMGILSTGWSNTQWTIGGPSDGYVYTGNGNLTIGTNSSSKIIKFFTGGGFAANERVRITDTGFGIHNTTPDATLAVTGTANISANVHIGGVTTISNTVSVGRVDANLIPYVNNYYTLGNSTNRWASLYVSGSTIYIGTIGLSDSGGNLKIPGAIIDGSLTVNSSIIGANSLSITGNATFSNTIVVTGNATFSNSISIIGNATFSNITSHIGAATFSNTVAVTGNSTFSNTIAVTGNATFSNIMYVAGQATFGNTITVNDIAYLSNNLSVIGKVTFSNTFLVNGGVTVNSSMNVVSNAQFANSLTVTGNVALSNTLTVTGNVTFSNTSSHTGAATFSNTINVTGAATLSNTISVTGAATFSNTSLHTGAATFSNTVGIGGAVSVNNSLTVNGTVTITNSNLIVSTDSGVSFSIGNSTVNTSINSTSVATGNIAGLLTTVNQTLITANNSQYVGSNTALDLRNYSNSTADTAYANAVVYVNTRIGVVNSAITANATAAFVNSIAYTDSVVFALNSSLSNSSSNATNLITGTVGFARLSGSYQFITNVGTQATLNANVFTTNSATIANSVFVGNNITVNSISISGNSSVTGNSVLGGNLWIGANLYVTGSTVLVGTTTGDLTPTSNSINLGKGDARYNIYGINASLLGTLSVTNSVSFGNTMPEVNARLLGNTTYRWNMSATTIDVNANGNFANISVSTNSTLNIAVVNTVFITGTSAHGGNSTFTANVNITGATVITGNTTVTGNVAITGNTVITGNSSVSNYLSINNTSYAYSTKYNVSGTSSQAADAFSTSSYRSAEYIVQLTDPPSSSYQVSKLLVFHDGTSAYITEYAQLNNKGLIGTFSADINSSNVRLLITPTTSTVVVTLTRNILVV